MESTVDAKYIRGEHINQSRRLRRTGQEERRKSSQDFKKNAFYGGSDQFGQYHWGKLRKIRTNIDPSI